MFLLLSHVGWLFILGISWLESHLAPLHWSLDRFWFPTYWLRICGIFKIRPGSLDSHSDFESFMQVHWILLIQIPLIIWLRLLSFKPIPSRVRSEWCLSLISLGWRILLIDHAWLSELVSTRTVCILRGPCMQLHRWVAALGLSDLVVALIVKNDAFDFDSLHLVSRQLQVIQRVAHIRDAGFLVGDDLAHWREIIGDDEDLVSGFRVLRV